MKQKPLNLIRRVPARRGSLVDTGAHQVSDPLMSTIPPQVVVSAVPHCLPCNGVPQSVPVIGHAAPGKIHRNDTTGLHLPQLGSQRPLTHVTRTPTPVMDTLNATLYPDCLRR